MGAKDNVRVGYNSTPYTRARPYEISFRRLFHFRNVRRRNTLRTNEVSRLVHAKIPARTFRAVIGTTDRDVSSPRITSKLEYVSGPSLLSFIVVYCSVGARRTFLSGRWTAPQPVSGISRRGNTRRHIRSGSHPTLHSRARPFVCTAKHFYQFWPVIPRKTNASARQIPCLFRVRINIRLRVCTYINSRMVTLKFRFYLDRTISGGGGTRVYLPDYCRLARIIYTYSFIPDVDCDIFARASLLFLLCVHVRADHFLTRNTVPGTRSRG